MQSELKGAGRVGATQADTDRDGFLTGSEAVAVLTRYGLPTEVSNGACVGIVQEDLVNQSPNRYPLRAYNMFRSESKISGSAVKTERVGTSQSPRTCLCAVHSFRVVTGAINHCCNNSDLQGLLLLSQVRVANGSRNWSCGWIPIACAWSACSLLVPAGSRCCARCGISRIRTWTESSTSRSLLWPSTWWFVPVRADWSCDSHGLRE